jgi:hypothetical protein
LQADAKAAAAAKRTAEQAASVERALAYQFPQTGELVANYAQIDVPAGLTFLDGQGAWFGLNTLDVPKQSGQQIQWTGLSLSLFPCDVAAAGRPSPFAALAGGWIGWGDIAAGTNQRNSHAYIVAGVLPWVEYGRWTPGPRLPGQTQTTAEKGFAPQSLHPRRYYPFPPGLFTATGTTSQKTVIEKTLPLQITIPDMATFAIALCIAPRSVNNLATASSLACGIHVAASFALPYSDRIFVR